VVTQTPRPPSLDRFLSVTGGHMENLYINSAKAWAREHAPLSIINKKIDFLFRLSNINYIVFNYCSIGMFDKRLFRDWKNIDYKKSPMTTIFKVIRYWDLEDLKNIKKVFDTKTIKIFLQKYDNRLDLWEKKLLSLMV